MEEVKTGTFFLGIEAYDIGLIDELGGQDEVEAYIKEYLGEEPAYVRYEPAKPFLNQLFGVKQSFPLGLQIRS